MIALLPVANSKLEAHAMSKSRDTHKDTKKKASQTLKEKRKAKKEKKKPTP